MRHGVCPMLSVVAMGMLLIGRRADRRHGSRGATPTIARRPHPVPRNRPRVFYPGPAILFTLATTLIRLNVLAHDAIRLHMCIYPCPCIHIRILLARSYIHTHVCLTVPCTPFDNLNSCVVQRRLPLIVLSGNAVERNFLVYVPT